MNVIGGFEPFRHSLHRYAAILFADDAEARKRVDAFVANLGLSVVGARKPSMPALLRQFNKTIEGLQPPDRDMDMFDRAVMALAVEDISPNGAESILGGDRREATAALQAAHNVLKNAAEKGVLIIESEPIIAQDLKHIISECGYDTIGIVVSEEEAIAVIDLETPSIVITETNLKGGGSGLVPARFAQERDIPVVFVTAYPEQLIGADLASPIYLVAKPFEPITVVQTIKRALLSRAHGYRWTEGVGHLSGLEGSISDPAGRGISRPPGGSMIIRDRQHAIECGRFLIAALTPVLEYDKFLQGNSRPPELWEDDAAYLEEIRSLVRELRVLNGLLAQQSTAVEVKASAVDFKQHINTFLKAYAKTLGTSAGIATVGLVSAFLLQLGFGREAVAEACGVLSVPI